MNVVIYEIRQIPHLNLMHPQQIAEFLPYGLRQYLKNTRTYHTPLPRPFVVNTPEGEVEINNIGKLLFGAPGWASILLFRGDNKIYIDTLTASKRLGFFGYDLEEALGVFETMLQEANVFYNRVIN